MQTEAVPACPVCGARQVEPGSTTCIECEARRDRARALVGRLGAAFCRSPEAQAACSTCQDAIRMIEEALREEAARV